MVESPHEAEIEEIGGAHERKGRTAQRRSHTPIWEGTSEWKFNELIVAITNMTGAIASMQQQLGQHLGERSGLKKRRDIPQHGRGGRGESQRDQGDQEDPCQARVNRETQRPHQNVSKESNDEDRELSILRARSMQEWESTPHASHVRSVPAVVRSHSHRATQDTNPLLGC